MGNSSLGLLNRYHYVQQRSENFSWCLTNPQLVGKGRKIIIPNWQRSENNVNGRNPLKRDESRHFPPVEGVGILNTRLFYFTIFHETSIIQVPHCRGPIAHLQNWKGLNENTAASIVF
jgi:hypothetical protein